MDENATPSAPAYLTVGALRKIIEGIDDTAAVYVGTVDTGLSEWREEECLRVAVSFGNRGAHYITLEGQR